MREEVEETHSKTTNAVVWAMAAQEESNNLVVADCPPEISVVCCSSANAPA